GSVAVKVGADVHAEQPDNSAVAGTGSAEPTAQKHATSDLQPVSVQGGPVGAGQLGSLEVQGTADARAAQPDDAARAGGAQPGEGQVVVDPQAIGDHAGGGHPDQCQVVQVRAFQPDHRGVAVGQPQRGRGLHVVQVECAVDASAA